MKAAVHGLIAMLEQEMQTLGEEIPTDPNAKNRLFRDVSNISYYYSFPPSPPEIMMLQ